IGEFAIGTNYMIDRFCNDILLDEKIGGTIHIALGRAYPECGGLNESAIHWDIVKDIRTEGAVIVDGKTIVEGGKILL
ncbi:MAG TPA: aminopeptidase, partial [Spirochaeta sp.]|nr:aminopeptidase [Spirochaeta sp.]